MTLEHQTRMTNLMTRIGWDARIALREGKGKLDDAARGRINTEIEEMVGYMLFVDEEPLKAPVKGVSTFTKTFAERGPRDSKGRSLRDFDLQRRLFRYPLSYMIYSAAFDGLPDVVRERVYQRLYDILTGKDQSKTFAGISAADRHAVLEILRATKPSLPEYWLRAELNRLVSSKLQTARSNNGMNEFVILNSAIHDDTTRCRLPRGRCCPCGSNPAHACPGHRPHVRACAA